MRPTPQTVANQTSGSAIPEALLHDLWKAANEAMMLIDRRLRIVAANPAAARMYRVRRAADLVGLSLRDLRTPEARRQLPAQLRLVDRVGRGRWQTQHVRRDGVEITVEASVRRVRRQGWRGYVYVGRDVTSRERAHEALRMQAQMLNAIGEAVIATDPAGHIIYANRWARTLYGWEKTDPVGRHIMEVTVPGGSRAEAEKIMAHLRAGGVWKGEFLVRHRSGRVFPARISNAPVFDPDGQLQAIIGVSADISDRKQTEELLRRSERDFQLLFSGNPTPMWVQDRRRRRILAVNRAAVRQYGYTEREFLALAPRDLRATGPGARHSARAPVVELPHRRKDGSRLTVAVTTHAMEFGGQAAALVLARDVTALRAGERQLREAHNTLQTIVDTMPLALIAGDPEGIVRLWNPAAERLFGWGAAEVLGRPPPFVPRGKQAEFRRLMRLTGAGRGVEGLEVRRKSRDGSWLDLALYSAPLLDASGCMSQLLGIYVDITKRKQQEAELRAYENQLHALVGRLNTVREDEAKRIARELHDDLGQRLTALGIELASLPVGQPGKVPGLAEGIRRMQGAVDQTIEAVQRLAGELRLGQLDVLGLTAAVEWQLQEFTRVTSIRCRAVRLDEVAGLTDEQKTTLYRILQEALTNIARHAGASRVELRLQAGRDAVTLIVRDNGRGISAAEQADPRSIGLLGMRERAQLVGGSLALTGRPGGGTTVQVMIPRRPPSPPVA